MIDTDYMDFLCWVDRCCLFPKDLANDLVELGMNEITAAFYSSEWCMMNMEDNKFAIVRLWQNYIVAAKQETEVGKYLKLWLNKKYTQWEG